MSPALLARIEAELDGLEHGIVRIELHVRDGHLVRAVVGREESILVETDGQCVGSERKQGEPTGARPAVRGGLR